MSNTVLAGSRTLFGLWQECCSGCKNEVLGHRNTTLDRPRARPRFHWERRKFCPERGYPCASSKKYFECITRWAWERGRSPVAWKSHHLQFTSTLIVFKPPN